MFSEASCYNIYVNWRKSYGFPMIYLSFLIFVCVFVEQKTCRKVGLFSLYGQLFLIFNEHWCKLKLLEYARSRRVVFFGK